MAHKVWTATAWALALVGAALPTEPQAAPPVVAAAAASPDRLPHRLRPDAWPYPDYYTEALKLTRFQPGHRSKALKLLTAAEPELLVLPVQMQAFGWAPGYAALIGAELDRELAARGQRANRQTDLYDTDGPYVRRFDDAQITAFAAAHPLAAVLALHVGRDGAGQAFITLSLQRGGRVMRAHRSTSESAEPQATLASMRAVLPAMLGELGLGAPPPTTAPAEPAHRCDARDWELEDLPPGGDRGTRACRALIAGTLMPEFMWPTLDYARPKTPNKLAWLAQAYVEADALTPAAANAVRTLAWGQLEISDAQVAVSKLGAIAELDDPVAQPLARLLWAWHRTAGMPTKSREAASRDYAAHAAQGLPPFAWAAFAERATFQHAFHRVDLCALELRLPALRVPAGCAGAAPLIERRTRPASAMERALVEGWRLARSYKDIEVEGDNRGDPNARKAVLDALPERIAAHPYIRQERFATEHFEKATGSYASLVPRAVVAGTDFVQTTADLQRWTSLLANNVLGVGEWARNSKLMAEPQIAALANEEHRLTAALEYDGYMARNEPPRRYVEGTDWNFLRPEPASATAPGSGVPASASAAPMPVPVPVPAPAPPSRLNPLFVPAQPTSADDTQADLERMLRSRPSDLGPRLALALLQLKQGQTVAQAQALVDARPAANDRAAIGESHAWSEPAHAFFFMGELDAAKRYYERAAATRTASESDLHARVRLRQIAGDPRGALAAARERLLRYEGDYVRRDVAGFEFMTGHPDRAWAVLQQRLPLSDLVELWIGAQVGHRMQGLTGRQAIGWATQANLGHAQVEGGLDIAAYYLNRYANDDRVPSEDDVALIAELGKPRPAIGAIFEASSRLKRLAFAERPDPRALDALTPLIQQIAVFQRQTLKPLYAWVAWQASEGKDPALAVFRKAALDADFDSLLAKALLLGLENQPAQALTFLRAARYELSGLSYGRLHEELRSAAAMAALAEYLLYAKTKEVAYRDEALLLARAYQKVFPFLAWPYALDALLSPDGPGRAEAACRAQYLDRGSLFLSLSGLKPKAESPECRKALW